MPFNAQVGSTIDYKSAKPTNWKQGDYTQWIDNDLPSNNHNPRIQYFVNCHLIFKNIYLN